MDTPSSLNQALLDRLATEQGKDGLSQRLEPQIIIPPNGLSFPLAMQLVKEQKLTAFRTLTIPLDTAQTIPAQIAGAGGGVYCYDATDDNVSINLIFSNPNDDAIAFNRDYGIDVPFSGVYATWSAQAGKTIKLMIIPISQLLNVRNNRKVSALSSITSITSISDIYGLTKVPTGATEVMGRIYTATAGANPTAGYTVTSGKTLYLVYLSGFSRQSGSDNVAEVRHTNGAGTLQKVLMSIGDGTSGSGTVSTKEKVFHLPIPIVAGHKLELNMRDATSDASSTNGYRSFSFWGWEI